MSKDARTAIEKLILEKHNHIYFYTNDHKDGQWSAKRVFRMFKNDKFWHVKYVKHNNGGYVKFRERLEKQTTKADYQHAMYSLVRHIICNPFILGQDKRVFIYGGVARTFLFAHALFKKSFYTFLLCAPKKLPKDLRKRIFDLNFEEDVRKYLFSRDTINDIDVKIEYIDVNPKKVSEVRFQHDVNTLRNRLDRFLRKYTCYYFTPDLEDCLLVDKTVDRNCHRARETSYFDGDYYNLLIKFSAQIYQGKKVSRWRPQIRLDVTLHAGNDIDFDINNFILKYENDRVNIVPRVIVPKFSKRRVEKNVLQKKFKILKKLDRKMLSRIDNMFYMGWTCDDMSKKQLASHWNKIKY